MDVLGINDEHGEHSIDVGRIGDSVLVEFDTGAKILLARQDAVKLGHALILVATVGSDLLDSAHADLGLPGDGPG